MTARLPEVAFAPLAQPLSGAKLRGLWLTDDRFMPLRNAAWLVRNTRTRCVANNPKALAVVVLEVRRLLGDGQDLGDVIEALCELLIHP
jgi:hypothetical protein